MPLDLSSEPFAASGGFAGEGVKRLMGAPGLSLLQTVLRESGQNSWDANDGGAIRIGIVLRTLTPEQTAYLRTEVVGELPADSAADEVRPLLDEPVVTVLEISDYGTKGLTGPTRADLVATDGEPANFVNFIRNIGARRDVPDGGGTYGYGKMALFAASRCSVVLVDSVARSGGSFVRRFVGCHVGDGFTSATGRKFTGRHWWGRRPQEDAPETAPWYVEPAVGDDAAALAAGLGLPDRAADEEGLGTTVQILLPHADPDTVAAEIRDALLWFFWPKMITLDGGPAPMTFTFRNGDEIIPLPSPEQFPPLDLFVDAWRAVKTASAPSQAIRSTSPSRHAGRMAIVRGFRNDRAAGATELIPATSRHVALMRPVELVVRYLQGPALPGEDLEWGGVFICDGETEIKRAFATSEPPAHDDWNPEGLTDPRAKRIVTQSLKAITKAAEQHVFPTARPTIADGVQPPLAAAAARLGGMLPVDPGHRAASRTPGLAGRRRPWKVEAPVFFSLRPRGDGVDAFFSVVAANGSAEPLRIRAAPGLVIDDKLTRETVLPGGGAVILVDWTDSVSGAVFEGGTAVVAPGGRAEFAVRVYVPGAAAVGLNLDAED